MWEDALLRSGVRASKLTQTIEFEVTSTPPALWSFDPRRSDRLFAPQALPDAALVLRLSPVALLELFGATPGRFEGASACGDLDALEALMNQLRSAKDMLSLRTGGNGRSTEDEEGTDVP
jgi:hypothetical protein